MMEFGLGFLSALVLVTVYVIIHVRIFPAETEETVRKLPGGGRFYNRRPDNDRVQEVLREAGLVEGDIDSDESGISGIGRRRGGGS